MQIGDINISEKLIHEMQFLQKNPDCMEADLQVFDKLSEMIIRNHEHGNDSDKTMSLLKDIISIKDRYELLKGNE